MCDANVGHHHLRLPVLDPRQRPARAAELDAAAFTPYPSRTRYAATLVTNSTSSGVARALTAPNGRVGREAELRGEDYATSGRWRALAPRRGRMRAGSHPDDATRRPPVRAGTRQPLWITLHLITWHPAGQRVGSPAHCAGISPGHRLLEFIRKRGDMSAAGCSSVCCSCLTPSPRRGRPHRPRRPRPHRRQSSRRRQLRPRHLSLAWTAAHSPGASAGPRCARTSRRSRRSPTARPAATAR